MDAKTRSILRTSCNSNDSALLHFKESIGGIYLVEARVPVSSVSSGVTGLSADCPDHNLMTAYESM